MAFTLEDGSGVAGANAYVSEAFATSHHTDRGNAAWDNYTSPEKQAAIIRATDYVDKRFGRRFRGYRQMKSQGLEWPRLSAFDDDGYLYDDVPIQLQKAVAEYALRAALCGVLAPDPLQSVPHQNLDGTEECGDRTAPQSGEVLRKKEKVGPLEEETWYRTVSESAGSLGASARSVQSSLVNDTSIPEYPEADLWIEELLTSSMTMRLVRA